MQSEDEHELKSVISSKNSERKPSKVVAQIILDESLNKISEEKSNHSGASIDNIDSKRSASSEATLNVQIKTE